MKNNSRAFRTLVLIIASLLLPLSFTGCEETIVDEIPEGLTGTWHQVSYTINGQAATKDSTRMLIQINQDQICILCDSTRLAVTTGKVIRRSGWSYSGGLWNLAIDIPVSWKPMVSETELTLEKKEFSSSGSLFSSVMIFRRVANVEFE